jgi:hypothetical protein
MSCNETDIDFLSDEINDIYNKFIRVQLFIGGILIITTITNMSILSNIKSKLIELKNDLKNNILPPLYKVTP